MNAMHANMEITDQFYSVLQDDEVKNRISSLGKHQEEIDEEEFKRYKKFLEWERSQKK